jgi:alkaline phosphatase D
MSKTLMSVHTFVDVAPKLPASVSVLLRGETGIGKSQIARQVARVIAQMEKIADYEVIDRRLSQMSEGDMVGLPSTNGEVTRFNPPDWYKKACLKPCFLFLDELNRATHEVMQAAFQIVLDRELNGHKLHPQTRVFSAINVGSSYTVNEVDPALLNRFWVVDLSPDTKDWLAWARGDGKLSDVVIDFIANQDKWLDPPKNAEAGGSYATRRSWERLDRSLAHAGLTGDPANPAFYAMCLGFLGLEATCAFHEFAKTIDNRVSGPDIIDNYPKVKAKIRRLGSERQNICIDKVTDHVIKNMEKLTPKQGENLKDFLLDLDGELRVACWSKLTQQGIDKLELAKSIHKYCAESILGVFGVPIGEAGVGILPNVPGVFQAPKAKK